MSTQPKTYLTPEQYLEIERKAETRSEYYQGEMFAMAGASWAHIMICTRLIITFGIRLDGSGCRVGNSDTRVNVSPTGLYTYPDLAIVCGQPRFLDGELDTLLNSLMVIEVLSPSTEKYDHQKIRPLPNYRIPPRVPAGRIGTGCCRSVQPSAGWQLGLHLRPKPLREHLDPIA
jgi:Uma2 family endonuclease